MKRIKRLWLNILNHKYKSTIGQYYKYENILLKNYIEIASSGDFKKLLISGIFEINEAIKIWEQIVNKNDSGTANRYNKVLKAHKSYTDLYHTYLYIKACCLKVWSDKALGLEDDREVLDFLKQEGYEIEQDDYLNSAIKSLNKSNNIISRLTHKENELERLTGSRKKEKVKKMVTFEEIMAGLTIDLGFVVNDSITLSRYNEYCKLINSKRQAEQSGKSKLNGRRRNTKR